MKNARQILSQVKSEKGRLARIGLTAAAALLSVAFILWASELVEDELSPFDNLVYGGVKKLISEDLTDVMRLISNLGSVYSLEAILAVFWAVSIGKRNLQFYALGMTINLAIAALMNLLFKTVFHRARPNILVLANAGGYSFPSGHSMIGAAFYGYLISVCILFLKKPWKQVCSVFLAALILLIGVSRIYLGVHYASDVVGGFLAGFAWLAVFLTFFRFAEKRRKPESPEGG